MTLSPDLTMRYRIHLPTDHDTAIDDECESCKISIQLIYDGGYAWLGIALAGGVDSNSPMIGAHAIVGQPGISDPATFYLGGKSPELVRRTELHVGESSIDYIGGRTVMDFTIAFGDWRGDENLGIRLNSPSSFLWAHGSDGETELNYHGPNNKSTFTINNLLESSSEENSSSSSNGEEEGQNPQSMSRTSKSTKSAWLAHGILAFLAFGIFVPTAISSALLRNCTLPNSFCGIRLEEMRNKVLTKYWLYIHMGFNTTAAAFTVIVFSVAVSNINREGGYSHWMTAHSKMGLSMFILVLCQVLGGYLRPSAAAKGGTSGNGVHAKVDDDELAMTEGDEREAPVDDINNNTEESQIVEETRVLPMKSVVRQAWELFHNILGIALFFFGVWQMYEGIELYHNRYNNASFATVVIFYFLWMSLWICVIVGTIVYKWFLTHHDVVSGGGVGAASENSEGVPGQNIELDKDSEIS